MSDDGRRCGRTLWTDGEPRGFRGISVAREAGEGEFISMGHVKTLPRKEARVSRLPERVDNRGSSRRRLTLTPFLDHRCSALGQRVHTGWLKSFAAQSLRNFSSKSIEPLPRGENAKYNSSRNLNERNPM